MCISRPVKADMTGAATLQSDYLTLDGAENVLPEGIGCVALTHNEMNILPEFLDHYRGLGVKSFVVINDHSTDDTSAFLHAQPDVTVYLPKPGSTYSEHKKYWRAQVLDRYFAGRWVFAPDIDEHFIFSGIEQASPGAFVEKVDAQGYGAVFSMMVDMYRDAPISEHVYTGATESGGLREAFDLFDGNTGDNYRLLAAPARFRARYPVPRVYASGGMRERVFLPAFQHPNALQKWVLRHWAHLRRPLEPNGWILRVQNALTRMMTKSLVTGAPMDNTKIALLKWQKGGHFSGGTHAVSFATALSPEMTALLHYKFTKGRKGLEYSAKRGQHAGHGKVYKQIMEAQAALDASPVFAGTKRYADSVAFFDALRDNRVGER